jgi:hypothetical protein
MFEERSDPFVFMSVRWSVFPSRERLFFARALKKAPSLCGHSIAEPGWLAKTKPKISFEHSKAAPLFSKVNGPFEK